MVERLRALVEHPLDPRLARAVVALAGGVTLGFAVLGLLVGGGVDRAPHPHPHPSGGGRTAASTLPPRAPRSRRADSPAPRQQDPQDRAGSAAHRRAERELATHRALQHVPYRRSGLAIDLIGARGDRAVLRVRARSLAAARSGWLAFLRRYHDSGRAYQPTFDVSRGRRG